MSRPRFIYVANFIFIFIKVKNSLMNTHTCSFVYLLEHVLLILDDNVDEQCE